jgi:hypothetical protein
VEGLISQRYCTWGIESRSIYWRPSLWATSSARRTLRISSPLCRGRFDRWRSSATATPSPSSGGSSASLSMEEIFETKWDTTRYVILFSMPGKKHDREPSSFQFPFCSVTVVTLLQRSWQQHAWLAVAKVAAQLLDTFWL